VGSSAPVGDAAHRLRKMKLKELTTKDTTLAPHASAGESTKEELKLFLPLVLLGVTLCPLWFKL